MTDDVKTIAWRDFLLWAWNDPEMHPRWIVIYYIHTPGSPWLGKGVEFFDEEQPARRRGQETSGTSRPFYPPWDRQYLGAAQGHAPPVPLEDYLQERLA